jgi:putative PIG3 family NAD(P)H quinone oxidoreductase
MRAVVLDEHGGPEVLRVREVPDPVPGAEEVLVEVVATALNRADLLQRRGFYPGPAMEHEIPGMELAGRVIGMGDRVLGRSGGDEVMAIVGGGADAELVALHERQTIRIPTSVPLADAAAIPEVFITAWDALVLQGGLAPGGVALVHAGASGVGTAAIQIARAVGARVVVTASAGKLDRCRSLGADLAIDYGSEDFVEAIADFTGGRGVDVVLDVIGGDYLPRNIDALAVGGRIVQVGVMGAGTVTFALGALLPKRASLIGTVLRSRPVEEKIAISQRFEREMVPWFESGALVPVIDSRFPLDQIADAHRHMEANANVGKILVDI